MKSALALAVAVALSASSFIVPAFAAGSGGGGGSIPDVPSAGPASIRAAEKLIKKKEYEQALAMLEALRQKDEYNADILNLMGFCLRKLDRLQDSAAYYEAALSIQADHRGALEYQGELHLMQSNLPAAEANLAKLAQLCPESCEEYEMLFESIADFKANNS